MSTRDPEETIEDVREKVAEGDEPSEGEREFLETERVPVEGDEEGTDRIL